MFAVSHLDVCNGFLCTAGLESRLACSMTNEILYVRYTTVYCSLLGIFAQFSVVLNIVLQF